MGSIGVNERTVTGMAEYIDREAAIRALTLHDCDSAGAKTAICDLPAADVAPVRHGRWDSSGKYRFKKDNSVAVRCTECGCCLTEQEYREYTWNYCPVCGAMMECGNDG